MRPEESQTPVRKQTIEQKSPSLACNEEGYQLISISRCAEYAAMPAFRTIPTRREGKSAQLARPANVAKALKLSVMQSVPAT
jgi:hypothetical protein